MISNRSTQAINLKAIGQLFPLGLTLAVFVGEKGEKNKLIRLCAMARGVTLNLFAIKSPWNKYALINMPSRNMLAENCPAEKMPLF